MKGLPQVVRFDFNKHLPQTSGDKTNDLFYILAAIYIADKKEREITRLTLEKTLFKTTQKLAEKNRAFLNTSFYINTYGPHNNIIYSYLEELQRAGLIVDEKRNIYLTPKGLRVMSELIEEVSDKKELIDVFLSLEKTVKDFVSNSTKAVAETHAQKVLDTTDANKIKTIEELIEEIRPEQEFKKASQFKYIELPFSSKISKLGLTARVINKLESVIANVEEQDFESSENLKSIFA